MKKIVLNAAIYQTGWFICALGASRAPAMVVPVIGAMVALQLWITGSWRPDLRLVFAVGAIGALIDSTLGSLGIMSYVVGDSTQMLAPPWLIALWMIFATTIPHALRFLAGRPLIASIFGALGGAGSYYAGDVVFHAIQIGENTVISLAVIAATWAVAMPFLSWLSRRRPFTASTLTNVKATQPILEQS